MSRRSAHRPTPSAADEADEALEVGQAIWTGIKGCVKFLHA